MSLIICASDLGLTDIINMGAVEAMDCGCISAASVLLNMPGTDHALRSLKERPWISFIWQVSERGRENISALSAAELEQQLKAEVINAINICGKAPCAVLIEDETIRNAAENVCVFLGIRTDWLSEGSIREIMPSRTGLGFEAFPEYDPKEPIKKIPQEDGTYFIRMYPGFLDDISLSVTISEERNVHRLADQRLLCSSDFKKELYEKYTPASLDDVFTGRRDFLNHWIGH